MMLPNKFMMCMKSGPNSVVRTLFIIYSERIWEIWEIVKSPCLCDLLCLRVVEAHFGECVLVHFGRALFVLVWQRLALIQTTPQNNW